MKHIDQWHVINIAISIKRKVWGMIKER